MLFKRSGVRLQWCDTQDERDLAGYLYTNGVSMYSSCAVMDLAELKEWLSDWNDWTHLALECHWEKTGDGNDCIGRNENWLDGKIYFLSANRAILCKFLQAIFHMFTHLSSQSDLRHQACKNGSVCQTARRQRELFANEMATFDWLRVMNKQIS